MFSEGPLRAPGRSDRIIPKRVHGYDPADGGEGYVNAHFLDMDQPGAAGGLMSTVDDLVKWDAALYTGKRRSRDRGRSYHERL